MDNTEGLSQSPIITTGDPERLRLCSLVLSAAHIEHTIIPLSATSWEVSVTTGFRESALYQIAAYDQENRDWPGHVSAEAMYSPVFHALSLFLIGCLVLLYSHTGPWAMHSEWFVVGAGNSSAILEGMEFHRLVTALTLHADLVHLMGNCFLGGLLLHFFFQTFGNGIGLFSLLLAATSANLINVVCHGPGHNFVGFSTAVFAVIGMLSSLHFHRHNYRPIRRLIMPLMTGGAMLAMVGSGGERTDLGAHFFGLVTGLAMGYLLGFKSLLALREILWLQLTLSIFSIFVFFLAWYTAFN